MSITYTDARAQVVRDRDHVDALRMHAEWLRDQIVDLMSGTGFEIIYDHYGDGGVLLRHVHYNPARGFVVDTEVPLEGE